MSDTRFILLGIGLIFAGFIVLAIFGPQHMRSTVEAEQFGNCYEYFEDKPPVPVDCEVKFQNKVLFFALVATLLGVGIFSLIKGARGRWDQEVKPQDMLGPGGENTAKDNDESDKKDSK